MEKVTNYLENKFKVNVGLGVVFLVISISSSILVFKDLYIIYIGLLVALMFVYRGLKILYICKNKLYTAIECDLLIIDEKESRGVMKSKTKGWIYTFFRSDTGEVIHLEYKNRLYNVELYKQYYLIYKGKGSTRLLPYGLIGVVER